MSTKNMSTKILGIETSCDETGVAVFDEQDGIIAQALYSQIDIHAEYGGVVPELASRDHIRKTALLTEQVMSEAGLTKQDIDGVAFTQGPGINRCVTGRLNLWSFACLQLGL